MTNLRGRLSRLRVGRPNPLFDEAWYLAAYPDIARSGYPAHRHYHRHGAIEGRDPNAFFHTDWYLRTNPDVAASGMDPLDHYLRIGAAEGRDPSPLFDTDWYVAQNADVRDSGMNPLLHYLRFGAAEGRLPRASEEQPAGHVAAAPRRVVAASRVPASRRPGRLGRRGSSGGAAAVRADQPTEALEAIWFDAAFYGQRYPDVEASGLEPLEHYRTIGAREGRLPNVFFDPASYAYDNPDVADYDGNPLRHYAAIGRARSAIPHPLFDPEWYARQYPDVGASRADPYAHYLHVGRGEGRLTSEAVDAGFDPASAATRFPVTGDEKTTVIVPVYGSAAMTQRCLHALAARTPASLGVRVIVADDKPDQPLAPQLSTIEGLTVTLNPENLGFLRNGNRAAKLARGEYLVFLNNDAVVEGGWLESMVRLADADPTIGMIGAMLVRPNGRLEEAGGIMFRDGRGYPYGHGDDPEKPEYTFVRDVDVVRGACFLVRRSVFEAVSGFDDRYAPAFFEEFDLAFQVRAAGHRVVYQPASRVHHAGAGSYGRGQQGRLSAANHQKFVERWADALAEQPAETQDLFAARERGGVRGTVVIVDEHVPEYDRNAGGLAIWQYVGLLHGDGFKVVYVAHDGALAEPYASTLRQAGIELVAGLAEARRWLKAYGSHVRWVMCARPGVAPDYIGLVRSTTKARLLYFTHDLHFLREERHAAIDPRPQIRERAQRLRAQELKIIRAVDAVVTPSTEEARVLRDLVPGVEAHVVPLLAVGPEELQVADAAPPLADRHAVIFVGGFRHQPNVDAAAFLTREIMPIVWRSLPDTPVLLVGSDPTPEVLGLAGPLVSVTGYVPDLAAWYAQARVSLNPLRFGAGVKGKIIGSLAAGVPVVTTAIGNEGLHLEDGVSGMIADGAEALAQATLAVLSGAELATHLAAGGRRVVEQQFSTAAVRQALFVALGVTSVPRPSLS